MKIIQFLSNLFINTMGITQPSPRTANQAAWFIVLMLAVVLAAVVVVVLIGLHLTPRH